MGGYSGRNTPKKCEGGEAGARVKSQVWWTEIKGGAVFLSMSIAPET